MLWEKNLEMKIFFHCSGQIMSCLKVYEDLGLVSGE